MEHSIEARQSSAKEQGHIYLESVQNDYIVSISESANSLCNAEQEFERPLEQTRELPAAVTVRNAHKSYQKGVSVLKNFNMTVPVGTIYSLLGSSGCGKTTLLSCCVGVRNLDKGEILVFGHKPGTKESGVPGSRVGYMPQELSLYNELSIQETLNLFGRVYGMGKSLLVERSSFLIDFLDLPEATRNVNTLSGGQKRRISVAIALLHSPALLVLDEPTVGVDPLLRESIWEYLVKLVKEGQTTVIITTHYIEEARQSDVIGILRNGRLLAERSPDALICDFNVSHLGDIVLKLCRMDREEKKKNKAEDTADALGIRETDFENGSVVGLRFQSVAETQNFGGSRTVLVQRYKLDAGDKFEVSPERQVSNGYGKGDPASFRGSNLFQQSTATKRLVALLIKNLTILSRNIGFFLFVFFVPAFQVILICVAIGSDPKGLKFGVINPESCDFENPHWRNISSNCPFGSIVNKEDSFQVERADSLSCFFLAMLPGDTFTLEREDSEQTALTRIENGYTYGYVQFPNDYSENVMCRIGGSFLGCYKAVEDYFAGSHIILEFDMSNKQVGHTMKRIFVETFIRAKDQIQENCKSKIGNLDAFDLSEIGEMPFTFKQPVYGKDDTSFREYMAPSILLGIVFFFPLCSSAVSFIAEKKTGTLDRTLVAGVGATEIIGAFLVTQFLILLGQAAFSFMMLTQIFHIEVLGSVSLALLLTILVGISGMSAGFLIAMMCSEEIQAVLLAMGTFFPNVILAGMVWSLEGMDKSLRLISYLLPCTLACESMRSIVSRGWTIWHRCVWPGFASTFVWIIVYWALAVIIHKCQRKG